MRGAIWKVAFELACKNGIKISILKGNHSEDVLHPLNDYIYQIYNQI